jgi:hypothetical protein
LDGWDEGNDTVNETMSRFFILAYEKGEMIDDCDRKIEAQKLVW